MNKKLLIVLAILVVVLIVMCIVLRNRPAMELPKGDVTTISDNDVEEVSQTEEVVIDTNREVAIDYTDSHKMLFDYNVDDLTITELQRCVNVTLESESISYSVDEDVVDDFILDVKQHADNGRIYLVVHGYDNDGEVSCIVDVCTYADRINAVLTITITRSEDSWIVHKE